MEDVIAKNNQCGTCTELRTQITRTGYLPYCRNKVLKFKEGNKLII